ncbi:Uncharacterized protein PBTT_05172 [Plasmodiophora brassicae]|uniref:Uncharacterized protein n=1 Tax=Plasmodiophora brassicae TaxID=37360 RepID=A0A0G4IWL1_PLABS|nr:hypothetical protein PBRA_007418 [Plasmodiophora brassicae]SPQ97988.1 unnamed protein product [Plasmodiophora brassicae]
MLLVGLVGVYLAAAGVGSVSDRAGLERLMSSTLTDVFCPVLDGEEAPILCSRLASDLAPVVVPAIWTVFGGEGSAVFKCITGQRPFMDIAGINWQQVAALHADPERATRLFETLLDTIRPAILASLQILNDRPLVQRIVQGVFRRVAEGLAAGIRDDRLWMKHVTRSLVVIATRLSEFDPVQLTRVADALSVASIRDAALAAAAPYDLGQYVTTVFDRMEDVIRSNMAEVRSRLRDVGAVDINGQVRAHVLADELEVAAQIASTIPIAIRQEAANAIEWLVMDGVTTLSATPFRVMSATVLVAYPVS